MISLGPDQWRRVRDVFDRALAMPAGDRVQFVADACLDDEVFHGQVATLLENGLRLAQTGETSLDEMLRILPPEQRA